MARRSLLPHASRTAVDTLYRLHARWLGGLLRRQLGVYADEAEDLVQEAYLRIARYDDEPATRQPRALLRLRSANSDMLILFERPAPLPHHIRVREHMFGRRRWPCARICEFEPSAKFVIKFAPR